MVMMNEIRDKKETEDRDAKKTKLLSPVEREREKKRNDDEEEEEVPRGLTTWPFFLAAPRGIIYLVDGSGCAVERGAEQNDMET